MTSSTTKLGSSRATSETAVDLFDDWFDPIEAGVRERVREFIQELIGAEFDAALARPRYGRAKNSAGADDPAGIAGHRHGSRTRSPQSLFIFRHVRLTVSLPTAPPNSAASAWNVHPLAEEPIVRLVLDGTTLRVRLDRNATSISLLVARYKTRRSAN